MESAQPVGTSALRPLRWPSKVFAPIVRGPPSVLGGVSAARQTGRRLRASRVHSSVSAEATGEGQAEGRGARQDAAVEVQAGAYGASC